MERIWPLTKEALKDIDQATIDKYKEECTDCIRCGYDGHRTVNCYRRKNADGKDLPPAPKNPAGDKAKASTSALKREPEDKEPDQQEAKKVKIAVAGEAANSTKRSWYRNLTDSDSDF